MNIVTFYQEMMAGGEPLEKAFFGKKKQRKVQETTVKNTNDWSGELTIKRKTKNQTKN